MNRTEALLTEASDPNSEMAEYVSLMARVGWTVDGLTRCAGFTRLPAISTDTATIDRINALGESIMARHPRSPA
jgi:hypothetical protein